MRGKVVVITGATSGIGRIAAERLAAQGARIIIVGRDQSRAERSVARLREIAPNIAHRAFSSRAVAADGLERTFALNHMAYFVLTHRLRERLNIGENEVHVGST